MIRRAPGKIHVQPVPRLGKQRMLRRLYLLGQDASKMLLSVEPEPDEYLTVTRECDRAKWGGVFGGVDHGVFSFFSL